jgi:site-specific DNA-methyltransferase (adenine-specific)
MKRIINENAIDVLDRMIAKEYKVDLIVTDPPYKVTTRGGYTNAGGMMLDDKMRKGKVFKENTLTIKEWLPKLYDVLKETGHCYIMCNNKNLYPFLDAVNNTDFHLVKTMIWAKDNKIMSQAYMSQMEFILFLRKGKFVRINNCGTSDLLQYPNSKTKGEDGKPIHSTEKPINLMKVLIENSSKENEIVLDPFLGVGSTAIASKELNRNYIGIELDPQYYAVAVARVDG